MIFARVVGLITRHIIDANFGVTARGQRSDQFGISGPARRHGDINLRDFPAAGDQAQPARALRRCCSFESTQRCAAIARARQR